MTKQRHDVTRREFLLASAAAGLASFRGLRAADRAWGVQLYTVRSILPSDPAGVLRKIAEIGYREVELVRAGMKDVVPHLAAVSLKPAAGHYEAALVTGDWKASDEAREKDPYLPRDWREAVDVAAKVGLEFMVISSFRAPRDAGLDAYRRFAEQMNRAAEVCSQAGLRLAYHNHAFEFDPAKGERPIDIFLEEFGPDVTIELDVFWASVAGEDPTTLIRTWGKRVSLLHLKDRKPGVSPTFVEFQVPRDAFREVGQGVLDFPGILAAAERTGVSHYFVEQDQCPGNPLDSIKKSFEYLKQLS
ncbi:MAG: sugar phosphate isomerase/epimerase [Acidobacteriota bacterium]